MKFLGQGLNQSHSCDLRQAGNEGQTSTHVILRQVALELL